jgi:hypothetical protein
MNCRIVSKSSTTGNSGANALAYFDFIEAQPRPTAQQHMPSELCNQQRTVSTFFTQCFFDINKQTLTN